MKVAIQALVIGLNLCLLWACNSQQNDKKQKNQSQITEHSSTSQSSNEVYQSPSASQNQSADLEMDALFFALGMDAMQTDGKGDGNGTDDSHQFKMGDMLRTKILAKFDADDSGQISMDEFEAFITETQEKFLTKFDALIDTKCNAANTESHKGCGFLVKHFDANQDGSLSAEEIQSAKEEHLAKIQKNQEFLVNLAIVKVCKFNGDLCEADVLADLEARKGQLKEERKNLFEKLKAMIKGHLNKDDASPSKDDSSDDASSDGNISTDGDNK